jgi:hypothetical protein
MKKTESEKSPESPSVAPLPVVDVGRENRNDTQDETQKTSSAPQFISISTRLPRVNNRGHKRYLVKWRIAIVYEGGAGKKTFHGRVNEISMGGLSIHCDHNVFHEGKVILLLALPPLNAGAREKILEITCRMNYTILSKQLFRIGLEFVQFREGEKRLLEERLEISNAGGISYMDA